MVQTITAVEACTAARKAYNEGRLLAQCNAVEPGNIPYGYEVDIKGSTFVCGIGACLSRNSLDEIAGNDLQWSTIGTDLALFNYIFTCNESDFLVLSSLQGDHDSWLMSRIEGRPDDVVAIAEARFLDAIYAVLGDDNV